MIRERDGGNDAGSAAPETPAPPAPGGPSRRLVRGGLVVLVAALIAVAVLATRLVSGTSGLAGAAPAAAAPTASPASSLTASAIFQRIAPSVVTIRTGTSLGTGVIVADNGTILTADHVVAGAKTITVGYADGTVAQAVVASANAKLDIATLTPATLPQVVVPANLGSPGAVGEPVTAIGNPLGLTDSVSTGVISGLNRSADTDTGLRTGLIQFDAAVNPGSSGGPLVDSRGLVVGIVVALAEPDGKDAFAGIGFAVPIGSALGSSGGSGKVPQI
jgi:putative serine protease PepD